VTRAEKMRKTENVRGKITQTFIRNTGSDTYTNERERDVKEPENPSCWGK